MWQSVAVMLGEVSQCCHYVNCYVFARALIASVARAPLASMCITVRTLYTCSGARALIASVLVHEGRHNYGTSAAILRQSVVIRLGVGTFTDTSCTTKLQVPGYGCADGHSFHGATVEIIHLSFATPTVMRSSPTWCCRSSVA
jgi:hypothetical protein